MLVVVLTNRNGLNGIANTLLIHQELRAYRDSLYEIPQSINTTLTIPEPTFNIIEIAELKLPAT